MVTCAYIFCFFWILLLYAFLQFLSLLSHCVNDVMSVNFQNKPTLFHPASGHRKLNRHQWRRPRLKTSRHVGPTTRGWHWTVCRPCMEHRWQLLQLESATTPAGYGWKDFPVLVGWQEGHLACKNLEPAIPGRCSGEQLWGARPHLRVSVWKINKN